MTGYDAIVASEVAQITTDITGKDTANSIDPADVGNNMVNTPTNLIPFINKINNFTVYTGTADPSSGLGEEGDYYYQTNGGTSLGVWRRDVEDWAFQCEVPLGVSYQDGIITGLRTQLIVDYVNVTSGSWAINSLIYSKSTPTAITFDVAEIGSDRIDTIYANALNQVLYLAGSPSGIPVKPTLPANTIEVDSIYVPADGTGNPYLFSAGSDITPSTTNYDIDRTQSNLETDGTMLLELPAKRVPVGIRIDYDYTATGGGIGTKNLSPNWENGILYGFDAPDLGGLNIQVITIKIQ